MKHSSPQRLLPTFLLYGCWLCTPLLQASAQQLNDPTRPYTGRSAPSTQHQPRTLQLQAIYRFAGERLAIIDGVLVREGDLLNKLSIQSIADDHVRYRRNGVSGVLHLPGSVTAGTIGKTPATPVQSTSLQSALISSEPTRSKDLP